MALRCAVYGKPEVLALIIGEIDAGTRRLRRGRIGEDEGRYKASSIANLSKKSRVKDLLYRDSRPLPPSVVALVIS